MPLEFRLLDQTDSAARFATQIDPDLLYLQGHFPGYPLLPGIAQLLAIALDRSHAVWPALDQPRRVTQLKFKRPIFPGDSLELQLLRKQTQQDSTEVRFNLLRTTPAGPELCAHGVLIFAPAPATPAQ